MNVSQESSPTPPVSGVRSGVQAALNRLATATGITSQRQGQPIGPALPSLPPLQVQSPGNVPALKSMPGEILDHIASNLRGSDVVAMSRSHRDIRFRVKSHVDRASTTHEASQVSTLVDFQTTLATIGGLPYSHQAEPLFQLRLRVHALPQTDRPQATIGFQARVSALPSEHRSADLASLARIAGHGDPEASVMVGEDVRIIARFHGIEDAAQIRALEFMAVEGPAYEAVKAGENVQDVAKRHGIVSAKAILELEGWAAFQGPAAYAAVQANDNERDVARQYGIVSADGILELEAAASLKLCSSERAARFEARRAAP